MEEITPKFWFLQNIDQYLTGIGLSQGLSNTIIFIIATSGLLLALFLLNKIGSLFINRVLKISAKKTKTLWDDFLLKRKVVIWMLRLILGIIAMNFIATAYAGFNDNVLEGMNIILYAYIVFTSVMVINTFLEVTNDIYESKPAAQYKSIKSYIQAAKVIISIIGGIFVIATLAKTDPKSLFVGLGASAAIISLIFRDVILGFVSSIQISAQDMIRPGDWIEVPSKLADGIVEDINITNVKIRNWDNTVTTVPIYTLVSDSFTNWRNMVESDGRRFKRPILIDINSVRIITPGEITEISSEMNISKYSKRMHEIVTQHNTSSFVTNSGLYRAYLEAYMESHPKLTNDRLRFVRYLLENENGITIELYGFTKERWLADHEHIVADIFDNAIALMPLFGLRPYQRPSDKKPEQTTEPVEMLDTDDSKS